MSYAVKTGNVHTDHGTVSEAFPAGTSVAIIQGRINYVALGTIIVELKRYVQKIVVLHNCDDPRIIPLSAALGVDVVDVIQTATPAVELLATAGIEASSLLLIPGDGSQDLSRIPLVLEYLKNGYDLVDASANTGTGNVSETILYLNDKMPHMSRPLYIACSRECLETLGPDAFADGQRMLSEKIYTSAQSSGMLIKHLSLGNKFQSLIGIYRIGVVVPAYNEELLIEETISGIPAYVNRIYVIDDCSTDRTQEILRKLANPRIVTVRHETNKGVGAAIITGYKLALEDQNDIVAVMAGDNQMDPEELSRLLLPIMENRADYTKGNRLISKEFRTGMSQWRSFGNFLLTLITKIGSGYWDIMDPQNGYTAISRQALEALNLDSVYTYYGYCNDLLIKLNAFGMRTHDVVMPARYGREKSKIKYSRFILKVAPMIFRGFLWRLKTKYMTLGFHPLVFFYLAGMVLAPIGVVSCLLIFLEKILLYPVSSVYPLLAAFMTLAGVQFLLFAMLFDRQENKSRSSG